MKTIKIMKILLSKNYNTVEEFKKDLDLLCWEDDVEE